MKNRAENLWQRTIQAPSISILGVLRALILWPLSLLYRLGFAFSRMSAPKPLQISIPLITVGGVTVGGSGKTPFVALLVRLLQANGKKVAVVCSGYSRTIKLPVIADGAKLLSLTVAETGDEPRELAEQFPEVCFAIGESKRESVKSLAETNVVDVIVIDDGFQSRGLQPDFSLALVNSQATAADFRSLPAGRLREPLTALRRADMVVFSKLDSVSAEPDKWIRKAVRNVYSGPTFKSAITLSMRCVSPTVRDNQAPSRGQEQSEQLKTPAFLVSGLADNTDFQRSADSLGIQSVGAIGFSDHFQYDAMSVANIAAQATAAGATAILTSAKDWVKLREFEWNLPVWTIMVRAEISNWQQFSELIVSDTLSRKVLNN